MTFSAHLTSNRGTSPAPTANYMPGLKQVHLGLGDLQLFLSPADAHAIGTLLVETARAAAEANPPATSTGD